MENCLFDKCIGRSVAFSGGGPDYVDTLDVTQSWINCRIIARKGFDSDGIYTSRAVPTFFENCRFIAETNAINFGILVASNATINGCYFNRSTGIRVGWNVGSDNIAFSEYGADIRVTNSMFVNSAIASTAPSDSGPNVKMTFKDCHFIRDSTVTGGNDMFKTLPGGTGLRTIRSEFVNCDFSGYHPGTAGSSVRWFFSEGGVGRHDVYMEECNFYFVQDGGTFQMWRQLRGDVTWELKNCYSPHRVMFDIDPYTGQSGPKIFATGCRFDSISFATDELVGQRWELPEEISPDTITATGTIDLHQTNYNTWVVNGGTPISNIRWYGGTTAFNYLFHTPIKFKCASGVTFVPGGGNLVTPDSIHYPAGTTVELFQNADEQNFTFTGAEYPTFERIDTSSNFTAQNWKHYYLDLIGPATVTMPTGKVGMKIIFTDREAVASVTNAIIDFGTDSYLGTSNDYTMNTDAETIGFEFIGGTIGWRNFTPQ